MKYQLNEQVERADRAPFLSTQWCSLTFSIVVTFIVLFTVYILYPFFVFNNTFFSQFDVTLKIQLLLRCKTNNFYMYCRFVYNIVALQQLRVCWKD